MTDPLSSLEVRVWPSEHFDEIRRRSADKFHEAELAMLERELEQASEELVKANHALSWAIVGLGISVVANLLFGMMAFGAAS